MKTSRKDRRADWCSDSDRGLPFPVSSRDLRIFLKLNYDGHKCIFRIILNPYAIKPTWFYKARKPVLSVISRQNLMLWTPSKSGDSVHLLSDVQETFGVLPRAQACRCIIHLRCTAYRNWFYYFPYQLDQLKGSKWFQIMQAEQCQNVKNCTPAEFADLLEFITSYFLQNEFTKLILLEFRHWDILFEFSISLAVVMYVRDKAKISLNKAHHLIRLFHEAKMFDLMPFAEAALERVNPLPTAGGL